MRDRVPAPAALDALDHVHGRRVEVAPRLLELVDPAQPAPQPLEGVPRGVLLHRAAHPGHALRELRGAHMPGRPAYAPMSMSTTATSPTPPPRMSRTAWSMPVP